MILEHTSNVSHNSVPSVSVRSQLQAERLSTVELSLRAANRAAHFSRLIHLRLFRLMSSSSGSLAVACFITSSMLVLLGASAGNTFKLIFEYLLSTGMEMFEIVFLELKQSDKNVKFNGFKNVP